MNTHNNNGNPSLKRDESDQLFDLLNLSPPGEYLPGSFDVTVNGSHSGTTTATSTPPFMLSQLPPQFDGGSLYVESPVSDINSPAEMLTGTINNRYQNNEQIMLQVYEHQLRQQGAQHPEFMQQAPPIGYQNQFTAPAQGLPLFDFDSPQNQNHLVPSNNNGFYANSQHNNSNSNLTVMSAHSYVSASQNPSYDIATSLLSPYESVQHGSMTPTQASSRAGSPFLNTSPYTENELPNTEDDNFDLYQTVESLTIDPAHSGGLELSQTEKALIELEFIKQESNLNIPEIVHANRLTEDNLNNNNTILQQTTPITINIQAPEDIAAQTPSLFSLSNSLRSTPINSPKNRSRSSSFENRERPHLGNSLSPSLDHHDSSNTSSDIKQEDDENLLKPGDGEFQRMRHGRRLSNASRSRSRSRSRSKSADSRQSDISDPTKNREKMIELAAPHSNKRTQKHPSVHACHLCDKTFTRPYNLKSHLRTHTDERPFICSTCGKAFARQHDKKRHEDLHTGEKRFQCKGFLYDGVTEWGCSKRFARADALGRHFKTESGRECVRPLLEDDMRRKSIAAGIELNLKEEKITDDMLNNFDFNEIFASQMGKD